MQMRTRVGWTIIATLLCTCLSVVIVSPTALAQNRGNSALPSGPGNPIAELQQQIAALTRLGQDVSALQQQLAALQQQMAALAGLQEQINTLSTEFASLSTAGGLGVFDAAANKIGDVVGVQDNIPWVSLTAAGRTFVLQVLPGQMVGQFLWYTNADCSGGAYISGFGLSSGPNVFSLAAVREPGGVVYAAQPNTAPVKVTVRSVQEHNGACSSFQSNQMVVPAVPVMTLDSLFQRPYSVH
jgi:hypothetical protein